MKLWTASVLQEPPYSDLSRTWSAIVAVFVSDHWTFAQWFKNVFLEEYKFCILFANRGPIGGKVEMCRIQDAWDPEGCSHCQWWYGESCHLMLLVRWVPSSPKSVQLSARKYFGHFMLTIFMGMAVGDGWFHFPAEDEDKRHQTDCRRAEDRYQKNLITPQADGLHATSNWCSDSCKRSPIRCGVHRLYSTWTYF